MIELRESVFAGCKELTEVTIGENVLLIKSQTFSGCEKLKKVTFKGNKVLRLGEKSFQSCPSLESIIIPSSVKIIGDNAFLYTYNIKKYVVATENHYYKTEDDVLMTKDGITILDYPTHHPLSYNNGSLYQQHIS